ncbi:MAG: sulfur oxidation c-type cytochrome SoxX [Gammaproteobacteria bacterium]|nr:sulfur oxidation c-type cytochrome SoxX [Gammaproteobacteria bacterium]
MRKPAQLLLAASAIAMMLGTTMLPATAVAASAEEGKKIAEDRKKGNCVSCHFYQGAEMAGTPGPAFVAMKDRFPDRAKLAAQISDPTKANPNTLMPPFGKHGILKPDEIDAIVEWLYTL